MNSEYQKTLSRPSNGGVLEAMPLLELFLSSRFLKEFMALHWRRIFERIERTNEPPQKTGLSFFQVSIYCQTLLGVLSTGVLCTLRVAG